MSKSIRTTFPLILTEDEGYAGVLEDIRSFIQGNNRIVGVKIITPFDGRKVGLRFYSSGREESDEQDSTIDVDLITSDNIDIELVWAMLESNIRDLFMHGLKTQGYICPMNPETDNKKERNMSVEKMAIERHLIRRGKSMCESYISNVFYANSPITYYAPKSMMKVEFLTFGEGLDKDEFDGIRVTMPIIAHLKSRDEIINIISNERKIFDAAAVLKIESMQRFKKSGFTMNYFECYSLVLTRGMELVYTFDIKKSIRDLL